MFLLIVYGKMTTTIALQQLNLYGLRLQMLRQPKRLLPLAILYSIRSMAISRRTL